MESRAHSQELAEQASRASWTLLCCLIRDFKAPSERLGEGGLSPSGQGALGETSAQGGAGLELVQMPSSRPPASPQTVSPSLQPRVGRTQWDHPGQPRAWTWPQSQCESMAAGLTGHLCVTGILLEAPHWLTALIPTTASGVGILLADKEAALRRGGPPSPAPHRPVPSGGLRGKAVG